MNRGELQLALRAIKARQIKEEARENKAKRLAAQRSRLKTTRPIDTARDVKVKGSTITAQNIAATGAGEPTTARTSRTAVSQSRPEAEEPPRQLSKQELKELEHKRLMEMVEAEGDEPIGHDVPIAGLTLRQLYKLKRQADAWHHVYHMKLKEQDEAAEEKKKKLAVEKVKLSAYLDGQCEIKEKKKEEEVKVKDKFAKIIAEDVEKYKKECEVKHQQKLEKNARFRKAFREDIASLREQKAKEKMKKIVAEKKEMKKARDLAAGEKKALEGKKHENWLRMMALKEEVTTQMKERELKKKKDDEETLRLGREWVKAMEEKDKQRNAAFEKIVAKQEAMEAAFSESTQDLIRKQLEEDEKKADEFIKRKWEEAEEKERQKVIQRKIATKEQLKSLEIAKQVLIDRKIAEKKREREVNLIIIKKDLDALEKDKLKKVAAKKRTMEHGKLVEAQKNQEQLRKQQQLIGNVTKNEMALNKSLFKKAGFYEEDE